MAFGTYNNNGNNSNQPVNNTYSPISFSNSESSVDASRFSISYFNKLMVISIARKLENNSSDYARYDNENALQVHVSYTKAKILSNLITYMRQDPDKYKNVCIELKGGLLKVSNGSEYGSPSPCISISAADKSGNVKEYVYQCKYDFYTGAYNYSGDKFSTTDFNDMELDTFQMCLEEYYRASSYAIAASVMEASMYKRNSSYLMLKAIADKVGAHVSSGSGNYNSKTFLSGGNSNNSAPSHNNSSSSEMNGVPEEYESGTFAEIAASMGLS